MRVIQPTFAGLALASLGSSATISWSGTAGSGTGAQPYYTCNETTTVRPTGPTGTGPAGTGPSGTGPVGTGPAGTAPQNSTTMGPTKTPCQATTTSTIYTTLTVTTQSFVTTRTLLGDGPTIDGDALTPTDGTATATIFATSTSTIPETTTLTYITVPQTTIGTPSTITVPPPTDFLPVQSTLPNATYSFVNSCNVSTITTTSTAYRIADTITYTTLTGTVVVFNLENTAYPASAFTNFSISYVTTTSTTSQYAATVSTETPGSFTNTVTATTTTVYEACATNNFADSVVIDHNAVKISYFDTLGDNQTFSGVIGGIDGPYNCCNYAFANNVDVWMYALGIGCAVNAGNDGLCTPMDTGNTATLPRSVLQGQLEFVIGNGVCGEFTKSEFDPFS